MDGWMDGFVDKFWNISESCPVVHDRELNDGRHETWFLFEQDVKLVLLATELLLGTCK